VAVLSLNELPPLTSKMPVPPPVNVDKPVEWLEDAALFDAQDRLVLAALILDCPDVSLLDVAVLHAREDARCRENAVDLHIGADADIGGGEAVDQSRVQRTDGVLRDGGVAADDEHGVCGQVGGIRHRRPVGSLDPSPAWYTVAGPVTVVVPPLTPVNVFVPLIPV